MVRVWVWVREEAMRDLSMGKQEFLEELRGMGGILNFMSERWG